MIGEMSRFVNYLCLSFLYCNLICLASKDSTVSQEDHIVPRRSSVEIHKEIISLSSLMREKECSQQVVFTSLSMSHSLNIGSKLIGSGETKVYR